MCWNMPILDWIRLEALWSCILKPVWSLKLFYFFPWDTLSLNQACRDAGVNGPICLTAALSVLITTVKKSSAKQYILFCFLPQIPAPLVGWNADLRKRLLLFLTVTVNPLPGCWILKKIIATFCEDLMLLWMLPVSQKSAYLWEVVRGWSKELGNFSPLSIHPSNTYRGSIIQNKVLLVALLAENSNMNDNRHSFLLTP